MQEKFITITGIQHYYGTRPFAIGNIVKLVKDYDNEHDSEAVKVEMPYIGKVGYVANSAHSVASGTYSAGRLYDTFKRKCYAKVMFVSNNTVIAKVEYQSPIFSEKQMRETGKKIFEEE